MSTLIIKSKVWNLASNQSINYKEKYSRKQKFTIDHSAIIYRQKDKLNYKKIDESNLTSNSNDNTFYMNEKKDELITILKQDENKYVVNCGNWSKDLSKLIDENAGYILYKGLTIENLLKEKQKYYVLNQGDIIKLGKIYLKLLHINLFNSDDDEDEEEEEKKSEANNNNSVKEEQREESKGKIDESNKVDNKVDLNEEDKKLIKSSLIEEEDNSKEFVGSSKRLLTYTRNDLAKTERNKKRENPLNPNDIINKYINCSFSYVPRNYRNINLYIKECDKENKKERLNKSFNGKIPILNANNIIKESFNINRSKSPKFSQIKSLNLLKKFESKKISNQKSRTKRKEQVKTKLVKNSKQQSSLNQNNKNEDNSYQSKQIINVSESLLPVGKICRICLSDEGNATSNPLICPCECKGSMRYIHYLCLKNWLNLKVESELGHRRDIILDQPTITYSTNDISCELCKAKLPDYIRHNGKIFNVLFYKPKYDKFIVLESMRDDNKRTKFIHIIPLVKKNMIKIGRLNTCDLSLPDISISRVHCCVYIEGGQLFMENNSKFGTKVLIQNNSLVMSSNFPLCIEIQNTYLKLILKKNFSFFGCCGVNTTTISKMLVYQEQNEKGFDIFCSMIIKDDKDKEDEKDKEEKEKEEKNDIKENNNLINQENSINNKINKIIEELKKIESIEKMNNDSINNKLINTNVNKLISEHNDEENNSYKGIQLINDSQRDQSRNHVKIEQDNNNIQNLIEDSEEILNKKKEEKKAVKSINIIKEDKKNELGKFTYRTVEIDNYKNLINDSEIKSRSNIYNEVNSTTQKFIKNLNDKILTNLKKEKYKNKSKEINKAIFKEISKEHKDLIDLDSEKENKNNKLQNTKKETQRPKIKKVEIEKTKEIIENNNNIENKNNIENNDINNNKVNNNIEKNITNNNIEENKNINQEFKDNEIKKPEKQELKKETKQILVKEENNKIQNKEEKKEPENKKEEKNETENKKEEVKKEPENKKDEKKKEVQKNVSENKNDVKDKSKNKNLDLIEPVNDEKLVEKKINEIKEEEKEELIDKKSNEESKGDLEEKQNMEMNQKKLLSKKFQERISNNNNNSINMKDTKSLSSQKDETTKNIINLDKTDTVKSIQEEKKIKNMIQKKEEKKINKEIKKQKKFQNNTIDLNEINELSYGKTENSCNLNYSPIDSYQSIFGLRNINNNEGSSLLAPKHKNINFQKLELNSKVEKKKFNLTNSNISRNKYTNQYEEDKKSKNNI